MSKEKEEYSGVVLVFLAAILYSLGGVCIKVIPWSGMSINSGRNLIALVEGVFFACMTVGSKKAAGTNPVGLTAVANTFTGAVVFLLFPGALAGLKTMTGTEWLIMLVLGVVQEIDLPAGGGGVGRTRRDACSTPCP